MGRTLVLFCVVYLHVIVEEVDGKESFTVLCCLPSCDSGSGGWDGALYSSVLLTFM